LPKKEVERMKQFENVVNSLQEWLTSIPLINKMVPFAQQILIVSLALSAVYQLIALVSFNVARFLVIFTTLGHYGFLLGFWLVLISPMKKWTPYALFAKALLILFPFTYFSINNALVFAMYIFFGYWLLKYTAVSNS